MNSPSYDNDEMPPVIVSLNISEVNETTNRTRAKFFEKSIRSFFIINKKIYSSILAQSDDASLNTIIIGIGLVVVGLVLLVIIIKLIYKCYRLCKYGDEDVKDSGMMKNEIY